MGDCKVKIRWEKDKLGEFCIGEGVSNNGQVIKMVFRYSTNISDFGAFYNRLGDLPKEEFQKFVCEELEFWLENPDLYQRLIE